HLLGIEADVRLLLVVELDRKALVGPVALAGPAGVDGPRGEGAVVHLRELTRALLVARGHLRLRALLPRGLVPCDLVRALLVEEGGRGDDLAAFPARGLPADADARP